jgi:large subunit ribosomal protein L18
MIMTKLQRRERIRYRIRKKVKGTAQRPRLSVYRSLKNIYLQLIDDSKGLTLCSASTSEKDFKSKMKYGGNIEAARLLSEIITKRILDKDINTIVFDRGGYKYHGRVKKIAEGLRGAGIKF